MIQSGPLFWIFTIIFGFIFQMIFSNPLTLLDTAPNGLLVMVVYFALRCGVVVGTLTGFIWGLMMDVASTSIFGSQTFMLTLIGTISGRLQGKVNEQKPIAQISLVFVLALINVGGQAFFESLFLGNCQRFNTWISLLQPLLSSLVAPIIFWILEALYNLHLGLKNTAFGENGNKK